MKVLVCLLIALALCLPGLAADATGKWSGTFQLTGPGADPGQNSSAYMVLKQAGAELTGSGGPSVTEQYPLEKGKVQGNKLTGEVKDPDGSVYRVSLILNGDKMTGDLTVVTANGQSIAGKIELSRVK